MRRSCIISMSQLHVEYLQLKRFHKKSYITHNEFGNKFTFVALDRQTNRWVYVWVTTAVVIFLERAFWNCLFGQGEKILFTSCQICTLLVILACNTNLWCNRSCWQRSISITIRRSWIRTGRLCQNINKIQEKINLTT